MTPEISIFSSNENELTKLNSLFRKAGFNTYVYNEVTPETFNTIFNTNSDVLLLDFNTQNTDSIDLCYQLKKEKGINSFIVLYAEYEEDYIQVEAFKAGADDYIIKPISSRVLVKRINALIKRKKPNNNHSMPQLIAYKDIEVDREGYRIIKSNQEIILPRKEFEMLCLLINSPQKVFTREEIFEKIWKATPPKNTRIIDVHIRKIREQVGENIIKTIKGVGYQLH